jgi:hypothetical protein
MGYLASYNTSSFSGSLDRGNINIAISSSIASGSTGILRFGDSPTPPSGGMVIVSDSNVQLGIASASATPQFWIINNLADTASVLNTINALPERVNQTRFTTTSSAYLYLVSSSKYFPILGTEPLNTIVTNGLLMYLDAGQLVSYPTTASSWYDISGYNNSGSLINGTSYNNGAIVFDGVDDYVAIKDNINPSNITLEFTYLDNISSSYEYLISNARDCCGAYKGYELRVNNGFPRFSIWNSSSFEIQSSQKILLNRVYHLVASYNGTQSKIYQNGVLIVTGSSTLGIGNPPSYNLYVGGMGLNPSAYHIKGKIYNSKVYNRELSQAEILQNYYQALIVTNGLVFAADASNLVSYESGSTLTYSLTGSTSGSLINGVGYSNVNGGTWIMDGADDFMRVSQLTGSNFPQATGTISFWYYVSSVGGNTDFSDRAIFDGFDTSGRNHFFIRNYYVSPDNIQVVGQLSGSGGAYCFAYSTYLPNDQWHNVVLTYTTGSNSSYQIYMDGVFKNSGTLGANPSTFAPNGQYCGFGNGYLGGGVGQCMQGKYSSLFIYNRALSATEIQQNYNAQRQRFGL